RRSHAKRLWRACSSHSCSASRWRAGARAETSLSGSAGRFALSAQELLFERAGRHWAAEEIALPFLAFHADQEVGGGAVLDPFGHDGEAKLPAEANRRADDRSVIRFCEQVEHERPIDLEPVERKFLQIAQTGITRAEIVEQDADAEL